MTEPIANLFYLLDLLSTPDTVPHFCHGCNNCTIHYGDLKKQLAEDVITFTTPIREVHEIIMNLFFTLPVRLGL